LTKHAGDGSFEFWATRYGDLLGVSHDHYMRVKMRYIKNLVSKRFRGEEINTVDIGCGRCESEKYMQDMGGLLVGMDASKEMIASHVKEGAGQMRTMVGDVCNIPAKDETFNLCFSICLLHHLEPKRIQEAVGEMKRVTKEKGLICLAEHNPLNPYTRYKVMNCPVDRDASLISPRKLREITSEAGLKFVSLDYMIFFPASLSFLSPLERILGGIPLGGQYIMTCEK